MNSKDYDQLSASFHQTALDIQLSKRPGYTIGSTDILANFKAVAARTGLTPEQAWCVYFLKHIDAITSIMAKPDLPVSEAPLGRFCDALNYLDLGWALLKEREQHGTWQDKKIEFVGSAQGGNP
jgi:hypothetical protein